MSATAEKLTSLTPALNADRLSAFCKAAGDELRLNILRLLQNNDYGVLELCQLLNVKQSGMSHHLKVLANAGLVVTRRDGNSIYYRRAPSSNECEQHNLKEVKQALYLSIDMLPIQPELAARIQQINKERSKTSTDFFQQNADRFKANQDLIASYGQYGELMDELVDKVAVGHTNALEVGPGEGDFLTNLSPRFEHVFALDNSAQMLSRAKNLAQKKHLSNVEFILGDTRNVLDKPHFFDVITLNMVLHHTPDPAQIFIDLASTLTPEGSLLVTELCQHDQQWTREACGDLWLGFEPTDLSQWANTAGLQEGESLYLAQRNGFQIQLRQFYKPQLSS